LLVAAPILDEPGRCVDYARGNERQGGALSSVVSDRPGEP